MKVNELSKIWKMVRRLADRKCQPKAVPPLAEKIHSRDGFMAISSVILISAAVLIIATTVTLLGISEAQSSFAVHKGEANLALVEGCVDDALLKARLNPAFGDPAGTPVSITRPEGTCVVTVVSKTGTSPVIWTMNVTSGDLVFFRKVQVVFSRTNSGLTVTNWKEI